MTLRRSLACGIAAAALLGAGAGALAQSAPSSTPTFAPTPAPTPAPAPAEGQAADAPADAAVSAPVAAAPEPAPKPRGLGEAVAAVVNGEIISTYDLRQRTQLLIASTGVQPTPENLPALEREALRGLIDERLELSEVRSVEDKQKGLDLLPKDKEVDAEIDQMAKQYHTTGPQLLKSLSNVGISPSTLRQQLTAQYAWQRYIGSRFRENIHVGDEQVNAYLARFNADAAKPQYQVSEVFIDAARVGGQEQAMQGAQQLVAQIRQGAPFAAVARQFSALPSAANGGDEGWLVEGQIEPALQAVLQTMRPGSVSDPIPVSDGVYILALREKRAGGKGGEMVRLQQAAVRLPQSATPAEVAAATGKLEQLKAAGPTCDTLGADAAKTPGVVASGDLGETSLDDLAPEFHSLVAPMKPGQIGGPIRTSTSLNLVFLCGRHPGGAAEPTRAEVENRLYGDQMSMISRRYLRDLRNSATIESR